jgi:hypothetical protein
LHLGEDAKLQADGEEFFMFVKSSVRVVIFSFLVCYYLLRQAVERCWTAPSAR